MVRNTESLMPAKTPLAVQLATRGSADGILKLVELFTAKQTLMASVWVKGNWADLGSFNPGLYLLRVGFPSGMTKEKVVRLRRNQQHIEHFHLYLADALADVEWALLSKPNLNIPLDQFSVQAMSSEPLTVETRIVAEEQGVWQTSGIVGRKGQESVDSQGIMLEIQTDHRRHMLVAGTSGRLPVYVMLPQDCDLRVMLRRRLSTAFGEHPLEVVVSTKNWEAEALLQSLKGGTKKLADNLAEYSSANLLLQGKYQDENAAAVGAYYLYLKGRSNMNIDWLRNLARDFPLLADGALIYGLQLINRANPSAQKVIECRRYLLEALDRGLPVYSMGFRLMRETLISLDAYFGHSDPELHEALGKVNYYAASIDYSCDLTTLVPATPPSDKEDQLGLYILDTGGDAEEIDWGVVNAYQTNLLESSY